jgi:sigma-B regulation protein RsbU (phosphoserine phosphatase)
MADTLARLRFPARTEQLSALREQIRTILKQSQCHEQCIDESVLAINEACMNIIQHGYAEHQLEGDVVLEIVNDDNTLIFRLTDFAPPVDISKCQSRNLDEIRPGGLGLHFIQTLMDEYQFLAPPGGVGNILELRKQVR